MLLTPPLTEEEQKTPEGRRREEQWDPPTPLARRVATAAGSQGVLQILYTNEGGDVMQLFDFRSEGQTKRGDPAVAPDLVITDDEKLAARYKGICRVESLAWAAKEYGIEQDEEGLTTEDLEQSDPVEPTEEQVQRYREKAKSRKRFFSDSPMKDLECPKPEYAVRGSRDAETADVIRQLRSAMDLARFLLSQLEQKL